MTSVLEYIKQYKVDTWFTLEDEHGCISVEFSNDLDDSLWDTTWKKLCGKLHVINAKNSTYIETDIEDLISSHIDAINNADLFNSHMSVDELMENLHDILSGNVGEKWFSRFIDVLDKEVEGNE